MSATKTVGRCLCGEIEYEYEGNTKWCGCCHCSICRQAHGAPFVTWFVEFEFAFDCFAAAISQIRTFLIP